MEKQIVIVTGATKGIGLGIAKQLVLDGYHVLGTHVSAYPQEYIDSISAPSFSLFQVDGTDSESVNLFVKKVMDEHKAIHALVNNAGVVKDNLLMRMSEEEFSSVLSINLVASFNWVKAVSKGMLRKRSGSIVNIASVIGQIGNIGQANYAASKGGMIAFNKSIAKELGSRNIRCNCIAPGFIETEMTTDLDLTEYLKNVPLNRTGTVQDVANATSFLISDKSTYISGQTLNVDGGMVML